MNTLIAVAMAPLAWATSFAPEVAEVVKVIRESGLPNRVFHVHRN